MIDIDITKLVLPNGNTIKQQFQKEADRFVAILQEEINNWYGSYSPSMYSRTGGMGQSINAANMVSVDSTGMKFTVNINYSDSAIHPSLFGGGSANTLLLMNEGYSVSNGWHKDIPYFGYRGGGQFLENAVARFNAANYLGIKIDAHY